MNNLATPQPLVSISYSEGLNLHTELVRLSMQNSLLQFPRNKRVGFLRGYSRRWMKPSKPLPRARRIPRLLFQLPPSTSLRTLTILNVACWQFELPALDRVPIVPDHNKPVTA